MLWKGKIMMTCVHYARAGGIYFTRAIAVPETRVLECIAMSAVKWYPYRTEHDKLNGYNGMDIMKT